MVVSKGERKSVLVLELCLRHFTSYTPNLGGYGTLSRLSEFRDFQRCCFFCLFVFFLISVSQLNISYVCKSLARRIGGFDEFIFHISLSRNFFLYRE